jgi:hypothetical protein
MDHFPSGFGPALVSLHESSDYAHSLRLPCFSGLERIGTVGSAGRCERSSGDAILRPLKEERDGKR